MELQQTAGDATDVDIVSPRGKNKGERVPKRVIHFSDGIIEEYSTDEEEEAAKAAEEKKRKEEERKMSLIDPKTLRWLPWIVHYGWRGGKTFVAWCDYFGEKIAWWAGITSPKYYYEIEEFKRIKEREEERAKREDAEARGWRQQPENAPAKTGQPVPMEEAAIGGQFE